MRGLLNGVAVLFFPRGADASVGGEEYSGYVANSAMAGFALSGYALCAHQTRTMKIGDITCGEAGFARPFRLSLMAKYSFRNKRLDPRLVRDCDCVRAMEYESCASRVHMRRPEGFLRCRLRHLRDSNLGNALQISPPPLQRSYNTLAKPAICSSKALFPQTNVLGGHIELLARYIPPPERLLAPKKSDFPPKTKGGFPPPDSALFVLSANPEIPRGGRAGFCGARAGAGAGRASEQVVVRPPASAAL